MTLDFAARAAPVRSFLAARRPSAGNPGSLVALAVLSALPAVAQSAGSERILDPVTVSAASAFVAHTPVAARDGVVYVATMEPGPGGDRSGAGDLRTVVRKGVETSPGTWSWTATQIDDRTVADKWHNAPSIGLDEAGHVHVAYNMHNLPWQYQVSRAPGDIDSFEFRGQTITQAEMDLYRLQNRTGFPDLGTAAIPGNQITYPAFENDRAGRLHVSYRFAAKPARRWAERTFSSGLARYDVASRTWTALGGPLELSPGDNDTSVSSVAEPRAVAGTTGWTSYLPRVTFGPDNAPTVSLMWREGGAGSHTTSPCAVRSDPSGTNFVALDGSAISAPALPGDCPSVTSADARGRYYSIGDAAADSAGRHHLLLSPVGGSRTIHSWTGESWTSERAPSSAVEIFFDAADNFWAVGTGPSVHVRRAGRSDWETVVSRNDRQCFPHAALDTDGKTAYLFTLGCERATAEVTRLNLGELLGSPIVAVPGYASADAPADGAASADAPVQLADASDESAAADGSAGDAADEAVADAEAVVDEDVPQDDDDRRSAARDFGAPSPAFGGGPLVLPRLEWRPLTLPESSVGLTAAVVFAELPAEQYGRTWTLFGYDPASERYFVPAIDEPLNGGGRYWAIQDAEVVVVVEKARGVFVGS